MYSTRFNSKDYQLDLPNSCDEKYAGGLWDLAQALSNRVIQLNEQVKQDIDNPTGVSEPDLIGEVYDFLQQFKVDSMALGGHTYGDITPMKADMWASMYDDCKEILQSGITKITGDNKIKRAKELADTLRLTGYTVQCDYSELYEYYDYEVWTKDKQYGIRIFFNDDLKLQKEFYGYISGDDTIYEDLTVAQLDTYLE